MCLKSDEYLQLCLQRTANMGQKTIVQTFQASFAPEALAEIRLPFWYYYIRFKGWRCEINTQFVVDDLGRKTAVILPVEEYDKLLEDIHDLAVIAERKDEPAINFDELKKRLKADGLQIRLER